jgi:membrane protease YdiL (CAAX protease family)
MAAERAGREWYLVDALGLSALVALYIWKWQAESQRSWWILAAWMMVSMVVRRDTPKTLGWRADNLWAATRRAIPFFVTAAVAVCVAGLFLGMLQRLPEHLIQPRRFAGYLAFCLLQQVALNSFLTNRLLSYFEKAWPAVTLAGVVFAALHWPNPVLVPLTLVAGVAMSWLFVKERNILPLALGQAMLGALVWWAFPLAWHHSMRVGPGYWTFHT